MMSLALALSMINLLPFRIFSWHLLMNSMAEDIRRSPSSWATGKQVMSGTAKKRNAMSVLQ